MNKKISQLICVAIVAMAAVIFTPESQGQYILGSVLGGTNNVEAATTNTTFTAVIPATKGLAVAVQPQFKLTDTGTDPVVLKFDTSLDQINWTVAAQSVTVTADGTNTVSKAANFDLGAVGYIRLSQVENPNAAAITNLTIKYSQKRGQ